VLQENWFTTVSLPLFHQDLNPTELIWNMVRRKECRQGLTTLKRMVHEAFNSIIMPNEWKNAFVHVGRIADDRWKRLVDTR
jgi:hypothetical protein